MKEKQLNKYGLLLFIVLTIGVGVFYIANGLMKTGGDLILPLDDPYIFFTYAKNAAGGHFFSYNIEDPPGLGITSLFYYLLCIIGYLAGFRGNAITWFSHIIGALSLAGCLILAWRFYRKRNVRAAFLMALLTLLFGKIVWCFFCGMEIAILTLFLFGACIAYTEKKTGWFFLLLFLAGLTRPEATLLLGAASIAGAFIVYRKSKNIRKGMIPLLPSAICAIIYLAVFLSTGRFFNTAIQKSPFLSGQAALGFYMFRSNENYSDLLRYLFGYGSGFLVLTTLMILGVIRLKGREWIFAAVFFFGFFVEGFVAYGMWHHQRYLVPYLPAGMVLLILGLNRALSEKPQTLWTVRAGLSAFILWSIFYWGDLYGDNCRDIHRVHVRYLEFADEYLDPEGILVVSDAGIMKYRTGQYTMDFFGLGSSRLAESNAKGGQGCAFETLRRHFQTGLPSHLKGKPVYSFVYWAFGGLAMEKASRWQPEAFLGATEEGELLLMAAYDDGEEPMDVNMIQALRYTYLEWPALTEHPREARLVAGYNLYGRDDATTVTAIEEGTLSMKVPEEFTGGSFIRLSVLPVKGEPPTPEGSYHGYIEGKKDFFVRPSRLFQFAAWDPKERRIKRILSYQSAEEGYGVSEFPQAWVPYWGFFGYRHQLGEHSMFGFMANPEFHKDNYDHPGSIGDIPIEDICTSQSLNMAEIASEKEFNFDEWPMAMERQNSSNVDRRMDPDGEWIIDACRNITGGFSFEIETNQDRPLHILGRFGNVAPLRLEVSVNGEKMRKPWFIKAGPYDKWQYQSLEVPAKYINRKNRIEFNILPIRHPHLSLYYLWFYQ